METVLSRPGSDVLTEALRFVRHMGPIFQNSVVAGGAVRDAFFEKPIADIDVFIGPPSTTNMTQWDQYQTAIQSVQNMQNYVAYIDAKTPVEVGKKMADILKPTIAPSVYTGIRYENNAIQNVFELTTVPFGVQLILLNVHPEAYITTQFPLTISQAWYTGEHVYGIQGLHVIKKTKEMRLTKQLNKLTKKEIHYICKICTKYPEFKLMDMEGLPFKDWWYIR